MLKNLKFNRNEYLLLSVVFVLMVMVLVVSLITKEGTTCIEDPLVYGADKILRSTNVEIECSCLAIKTSQQYNIMYFNSSNVWFGNKYYSDNLIFD